MESSTKKTRQGSSSNHFQLVPVDEFRQSSILFFTRKKKMGKGTTRNIFFCLRSLTASATLLTNECFSRYGQSSIIRLLRCAITHAVGCCACVMRDWRVLREVVTRVTRSLPHPPTPKKEEAFLHLVLLPSIKNNKRFFQSSSVFPFFFFKHFL